MQIWSGHERNLELFILPLHLLKNTSHKWQLRTWLPTSQYIHIKKENISIEAGQCTKYGTKYRANYHIHSQTLKLAKRSKDVMRKEISWNASISKSESRGNVAKTRAEYGGGIIYRINISKNLWNCTLNIKI